VFPPIINASARISRETTGRVAAQMWVAALLITVVTLFVFPHDIQAQTPDDEALSFDIMPQPLDTALEAFGERSRLQILYETALTAGRRSSGVRGIFTRSAALRQLLAGTGLEPNYTGERAFTVMPIPTAAAPKSAIANFNPFLGGVQANVLSVLCRNAETRPGPFRLAVQFWIANSGQVEDPRLLGSTGTHRRDAAIAEALRSLAFGRSPPSDMPQPITMVLQPGPADARDECVSARP
jgi:hypothetical protein